MKRYKILVPLVNRTNYSKIKPILSILRDDDKIDVDIVVSSAMISDRYGEAVKDVEKNGFKIHSHINCLLATDKPDSMGITSGLSMIQCSQLLLSISPDMLLIVGDRFDMFPFAISASYMNIPIAHIQGGEVSGSIDDKIRKMISIVSDIHFPATEKSKERLIDIGISSDTIYNFGCPIVEYISTLPINGGFNEKKVGKFFKDGIDISSNEKYFLVMVHPETTNEDDVDMGVVLDAVEKTGIKSIICYPNPDLHNSKILRSINRHKKNKNFYMIKHAPLDGFVHMMANCACMIGNSSAGIREAASFGIPVINVGQRQINRERNTNTIDFECNYDKLLNEMKSIIRSGTKYPIDNVYYKPNCSRNICSELYRFMGAI